MILALVKTILWLFVRRSGGGRQLLDISLSVQFSGLPNLAKLELVKSTKSRAESSVVIALQPADGQRFQAEFFPSDTLWHVLEHFSSRFC